MKLYSTNLSPFAARVRIALYHKGLAFVDMGLPPGGLKSAEFLAINPMGRIPVLILADGSVIPESETILEYLQEAYPAVPLLPDPPAERARVRTLMRVTDNYVTPPTARLFAHLDPAARNAATVTDELQRMREGLRYLNYFVNGSPYACGSRLSLADCCLFPSLYLCEIVASQLGEHAILEATPRLARYFRDARSDASLGRAYEEIGSALRAYQQH